MVYGRRDKRKPERSRWELQGFDIEDGVSLFGMMFRTEYVAGCELGREETGAAAE